MKKLLVFFVMMLSLIGGIMAIDPNQQAVDATVSGSIIVAINPLPTLNFGTVIANSFGNAALNGPVIFNPAGSTTGVSVEVTDVTGAPFDTGLKFDGTLAELQKYDIPCVLSGDLCTFTAKSVVPTLDVPTGSSAGLKSGVITYTFTEYPAPVTA